MKNSQITILGARGSMPVSGEQFSTYGGATACVLLETASDAVIFDAGTGLMNLPERVWKEHEKVHVFFTHFHIDHMLGILTGPIFYDREAEVILYVPDEGGFHQAMNQMMQKPLWPVDMGAFRAKVAIEELGHLPCYIGDDKIAVSSLPLNHPGGAVAYRAEWNGKSMVYATDCEIELQGSQELEDFARDTQLFILDAQYIEEEYEGHRGYGHSSVESAAAVIAGSGTRRGLLFHHAPTRTDLQLARIEEELKQKWINIGIAKEGDKILL